MSSCIVAQAANPRHPKHGTRLLASCFVILLALDLFTGRSVSADPVKALRDTDFLSSIGACTHIAQGIDEPAQTAACLKFAGIRNIRDDGSLAHVADWILVHKLSGVRLSLLTNRNIPETISMASQLNAAGALLAVEGPNEPNNWPVTYQGETSGYNTTALPIAKFQRDLYLAVKTTKVLANVPVFATSEAGGSEKDNVGLQYLTIPPGAGTLMPDGTKYADLANCHNYVCGHKGVLVDNVSWDATDPTLNGDWDGMYVEYGHTWHGGFTGYTNDQLATLPKVCTETGWVTTGEHSITQEQQGCVFLNLYLDAFKQGWKYTFVYMLRDDAGQGYWGFFDTGYKPKISGTYLHNLTTILSDSGNRGKTGSLDYTIDGQPDAVHDLLLQKGDGAFDLVVWDEQVAGSSQVTVNLGGKPLNVTIYDPTTGTDPVQTVQNAHSISLTFSDHPEVIEIGKRQN